ncbi:restriction endonuclease [Pueribacillus theae]|uniref:Restriction endonuclease n=1 Tax=Pueribacillus theae TaxID=2171751 RepID=A0A2U1JWD5_9BACI|nr:restriction endonuclease [Pueribacillus theae]PWA09264.1 restriction endonuclease [Pueribacillus theae]
MFNFKYHELINPTLQALKKLGGSATNNEITEQLIELLQLTEDEANDIHKGSTTKLAYRSAWARTYLKGAGYIDNSKRGVWVLTDKGKKIDEVNNEEVKQTALEKFAANKESQNDEADKPITKYENEELDEFSWHNELLETLKNISPDQFEKLCQRLLRELGFINVEVTGKSHDGGIDGKGILKIGGVISFHTAFQAKRYNGSVGSSVIRDFRGATVGKADRGLVITTGSFTREAVKEANRDGATPIDLIDGNELAEKLKELGIGIKVEMVEKVTIDIDWFNNI